MKIFDFHCPQCETVEERLTKEGEVQYCTHCGAIMVRQIAAPGMVKTNFADKTGFKKRI